ncbi:DNA mismatch repair protein [Cordyceps militaris CM01]|uniref:DNA mismatch repair protein n=1 Tax=Cordyceps militaris (strain CM01) TaxID=983644 RepID=G3JL19_CORMM|nr:DNA mismatch repair protein [Cordyceps militaris CM01]EGX90393.1 DNA mismatch repair protein [Cordyceps militaris CM01]
MPITQLSAAAARLIGSSAAITSPYDVVKELLDNAIDAGADTVEIAIAPNTLDQVRVRDNGRGIPLDDLNSLGRPAHTSKLVTLDELTAGRVATLGFRGQALASINSIAATVQVTTKTAEEPVAARVQLQQAGVEQQRLPPVSAPTGTAVQVMGLFARLRPRWQMLLKEGSKTIVRIKGLLTAYVLADAALRVTFKVLGDERQTCRLGQSRDRDMTQSVLEVFGAAVAASGQTHRFASAEDGAGAFTLVAFLPAVDGDQRVVAGKGAFISVNGRPISSATGIGKALVGVFKTKVQQHWQQRGLPTVQKPLLLLEIRCPLERYDVNVATMKDEVMFAEAGALLRTFEELCVMVYCNAAALGSSRIKETSQELVGMSTDSALAPATEKLVSAQMRTACKVNMQRTNSNATDEETDFRIIEVEVPEIRLLETKEGPKKQTNFFVDTTPKPARGIERYFQPTGADFEIATDETATPERPQPEETSRTIEGIVLNGALKRMPLHDVPDTTLNTLAGIHGSPSSEDASSPGEGPRLSDLHGTSWSIQNLIHQRVLDVPSTGIGGGPAATASASPVPQTRGGGLHEAARRQVTHQLPILRTPPPSDPMREESRFVLPGSLYGAGSESRRQPSPASSSSSSLESGAIPVKETRGRSEQQQQRLGARRALPGTRNDQVNQGRGVLASGAPRLGLPRQRTTTTTTMGRLLPRRQEHEEHGDAAAPERGIISYMRYGDRGRAQLEQTNLVDWEMSDAESVDSHPQPKRRRAQKSPDVVAPVQSASHTRHATPHLVDGGLPLESIPSSLATWGILVTASVSFSDIRLWTDLERDLDLYIRSGTLAWGLRDLTGGEAARLEECARRLCRA